MRPCYSLDPETTWAAVMAGTTYLKLIKGFTAPNFDLGGGGGNKG